MKVCVFGGDGFIGRRVVRQLAEMGHEIASLDITTATSFAEFGHQVRALRVNISMFDEVAETFKSEKPDVIINLAYMRETTPHLAMKVNVLGMDNCFEAARIACVERVVYSSSIAVNGRQAPYGVRPISESETPHPITQYAVHKVFNEWQASEYRKKHGMRITGLRAAHIAATDKIIGSVDHVQCIVGPARGEKMIFEHRDQMRCIVHADDIADVFIRLALAESPRHALYNSGGETISLGALAEMVRDLIPDADISFRHESGGEAQSTAYLFDDTRLRDEFGIQYRPYKEHVARMIESIRKSDGSA